LLASLAAAALNTDSEGGNTLKQVIDEMGFSGNMSDLCDETPDEIIIEHLKDTGWIKNENPSDQ
jgi:hypothetical protein